MNAYYSIHNIHLALDYVRLLVIHNEGVNTNTIVHFSVFIEPQLILMRGAMLCDTGH